MTVKKGFLLLSLLTALSMITWATSAIPSGHWVASIPMEIVEEELSHQGLCGQQGLVCAKWLYGDGSGQMASCCIPADKVGSKDLTACNENLRHTH